MISKLKKLYQYGIYSSIRITFHRLQQWHFAVKWRKKITNYTTADYTPPQSKHLSFVEDLCKKSDHTECIRRADDTVEGYISVLGSSKKKYTVIPWHADIRLAQQCASADSTFERDLFFKDICIATGHNPKLLTKDIKIPWELSRLQELPILGHAYLHTKNERYAKSAVGLMLDWSNSNSFLHGSNWANPMEVGLRAVSIILALSMIEKSKSISLVFSQKMAGILHEHYIFIEHNFEWYDGKTSNHYLSDLVGYVYLSWFFDNAKNARWAIDELKRELHKQLLPDGTSYEGSTKYHQLVTELIYYAELLIMQEYPSRRLFFAQSRARMDGFLWWCTPHNGALIAIGDDDSGRVTQFDYQSKKKHLGQHNFFKQFGLSVYKTHKAHVTLRHHAYRANQPAGHFHNDVASITVTVHGIPIIVDPGSFVYTPSAYWRNYFRSVEQHNTSYPQATEPCTLTNNLFSLGIQERKNTDTLFYAQQHQYHNQGLYFERKVLCTDEQITLNDAWQVIDELIHNNNPKMLCWNFMLHPDVLVRQTKHSILLLHNDQQIAALTSPDLAFTAQKTWYAPSYGTKVPTFCIRSSVPCAPTKVTIIIDC